MGTRNLLRIGCAAGFSGDRTDAALPVVEALLAACGPAVLIFETLAERTLALAQLALRQDPTHGYDPLLADRLRPILGRCLQGGVPIVSNFGAANPMAAARRIQALAAELEVRQPRIAVIEGDDLSGPRYRDLLRQVMADEPLRKPMVSANAYLGAEAIAAALDAGAEIVVGGRIADPSLVVGPVIAHFGWAADDWNKIAGATMAGHLLECGAQVTGGYFADPGYKEVPDLASVGFPIAEVDANGECIITKPAATGGEVDERVVKEQLLYEIHDPAAYATPDVVADIGQATVQAVGSNRVRLSGVRGHARPSALKVNVCYENGWLGEGEISYAGARAEARARLAASILRQRLSGAGPMRVDLIGVSSVLADDEGVLLRSRSDSGAKDVRLRVSLSVDAREVAERLGREVTALYTCGPAGGGGVRTGLHRRFGILSCAVPHDAVSASFTFVDPSQ